MNEYHFVFVKDHTVTTRSSSVEWIIKKIKKAFGKESTTKGNKLVKEKMMSPSIEML